MSEQVGLGAQAPEDNVNEGLPPGVTAGTLLRQAREAMGVHVAALAVALKVPVSKIEALEADRHDEFPDNVFMRALAASVSRTLKVDAAQVLALLPSGMPQPLHVTRGLNASFKDPTGRFKPESSSLESSNKSRWVGVAVVGLLIGALAVAFMPRKEVSTAIERAGTTMAANDAGQGATTVSEPVAAVDPGAESAAPSPATTSAPATAPAQAASASTVTTPPSAANQGASAAVVAAMAPAPAGSAPLPAGDPSKVLEIRARAPSWIKIVSSVNGVVLQRELAAGESVVATGSPPWSVTVGRPDATDVIVRGEPMSMANYAHGKVARFEVK
ncbi:MAG: DUF4115 domain-containing protein [Burkholderiaceae bacterium]|jgi:cytoskeleton protein RodZ|nr:DUF4115 domain-containing protein [Burkholderiaceae bacterium]